MINDYQLNELLRQIQKRGFDLTGFKSSAGIPELCEGQIWAGLKVTRHDWAWFVGMLVSVGDEPASSSPSWPFAGRSLAPTRQVAFAPSQQVLVGPNVSTNTECWTTIWDPNYSALLFGPHAPWVSPNIKEHFEKNRPL